MKIQIEQSRNGQYFWRMRADNGQVLATSENYTSKSSAKKSAESVSGAKQVQIEDISNTGSNVSQVSRKTTVRRKARKKAPAKKRAAKKTARKALAKKAAGRTKKR